MNLRRLTAEVFAFFFLFFSNFIAANAQTEPSIYELVSGTTIRVSMDNAVNSKVARVNDTFTATVAAPVVVNETTVLPIGTIIEGRVTKVRRAALGGKNGSLEVEFQTLKFANGAQRKIEGLLVRELKAESSARIANVLTVIGGTAIGAVAGAVSKVNNGALIGAGVGAGAGTSVAFLRKGKNVGIKADEEFEIKLTRAVTLPVQDF